MSGTTHTVQDLHCFLHSHTFSKISASHAFHFLSKHLLQAMNSNTGILKKGREVKTILRDRAYSSMPVDDRAIRPAARNYRNHTHKEEFNDFRFIKP